MGKPSRRKTPQVVPDRESTLGALVRSRRRANGLTQRELGELAGVGTRLVSELERDKPTLRMDAVNRVLGVFGKQLGAVEARREGAA
jgi:y4mF family transcriptional regulator